LATVEAVNYRRPLKAPDADGQSAGHHCAVAGASVGLM